MGIPCLILGESGSGKSTSLRNFKPDEVAIFNVASKPLPFRNKIEAVANGVSYPQIFGSLRKTNSSDMSLTIVSIFSALSFFRKQMRLATTSSHQWHLTSINL